MSWRALLDFLAMDSHGVYVWGAYALALGLVLVEVVLLFVRKRTIFGYLGWRAATIPVHNQAARIEHS